MIYVDTKLWNASIFWHRL